MESKCVENWTNEQVKNWITKTVKLPEYENLFEKHKIKGIDLLSLKQSELEKLGINALGDLKQIMREIENLKQKGNKITQKPMKTNSKEFSPEVLAIASSLLKNKKNSSTKRKLSVNSSSTSIPHAKHRKMEQKQNDSASDALPIASSSILLESKEKLIEEELQNRKKLVIERFSKIKAKEGSSSSLDNEKEQLFTCPVCFIEKTPEEFFPLSSCNHVFCLDCFNNYLEMQIKEKKPPKARKSFIFYENILNSEKIFSQQQNSAWIARQKSHQLILDSYCRPKN